MTTILSTTRIEYLKHRRLLVSSLVLALILATLLPGIASAEKPPQIPAWHDGEIVFFTVVSENVEGVDMGSIEDVAIPLYAFGPPGNQPQFDVLSHIPGDPGYNPWWKVIVVIPLDGRDVSVDPFTSEAEILAAADDGSVLLLDINFVFLCQVLPGR